ncbi:MAG: helix-turn-helix domain-containing GNAT family N-acetyltransferase [Anaeroplasmataceae bacterium]|nr:helix-turn-helix domain-containing GNAT family N-acetyltransferase [Anaeroplasmataceae bacterium]
MDIREKTTEEIRKFNQYYTVHMQLLHMNYLDTFWSLAEIRILFEIWKNKECIQDTIVQALQMDKSYLSKILQKFEKNHLIKRVNSQEDKRKMVVCLTDCGKTEVENLIQQTHTFIEEKIAKLTDNECDELCNALSSILHLLKKGEQSFKIVPFEECYRQSFIALNTDWITTYFGKIEKHNIVEFENIDEDIKNGAMIFFAVKNGSVLATCMAKPLNNLTWEICKLGSNKSLPHKGAGSAVFEACMNWAFNHGAARLFIVSNRILKPALHIYQKYGFKEIELKKCEYERGDIAFEYIKEY